MGGGAGGAGRIMRKVAGAREPRMGLPPMPLGTGVVLERPNCLGLVQALTEIRIKLAALVSANVAPLR